ncbi:ribose-phosphate pyrophosphokinase-like domain-containing protein [Candidatus Vidania fulgoroideorum]
METLILCNKKNIVLREHIVINRMIFSDGEKYLNVRSALDIKKKIVLLFIIGDEKTNDMFVELMLILDILKKRNRHIVLLIPYLFYARQDRWISRYCSIGLRSILYLLRIMGVRKIFTIDIHKLVNCRFLYNISLAPILRRIIISQHRNCRIVFPDLGAYKRYRRVFDRDKISFLYKRREGRKVSVKTKEKFYKDDCISVVDDIVDTGGTLEEVYKLLIRKTCHVYFYTIHGVFSLDGCAKRLNIKSFNTLFRRRGILGRCFFYSKSIITSIINAL